MDLERRARRLLVVVRARDLTAEDGHDRVTDMLVDRAAEFLDDAVDGGEEAPENRMRILQVEARGHAGEPRQVDEHDRDLTLCRCRLRCRVGPARRARLFVGQRLDRAQDAPPVADGCNAHVPEVIDREVRQDFEVYLVVIKELCVFPEVAVRQPSRHTVRHVTQSSNSVCRDALEET